MNSLSPGHPLFNPRRVPPALKPIEETEGHYWSMRELTLFEREIKRQTDIRITEHTPAELNKMRRCKYCGAAGGSHHKKTGPPKKKLRMDLGCFWPDKMNKIFCHEVARVDLGKREYVKKAAIPNDFNRVLKAYFENAQLGRSKVVLCDQVKLMEMVVDMENQLDNTHFLIDPKNHHLWVEVTGSSRSGYVMFEIYQVSEEKWKDSFSNACAPICAWHFGAFDGNAWNCCKKPLFAEGCYTELIHCMRPLYSCAHVATRKSSYPGPDWGDPVEPVEPVEEEPKYTSPIELFDTPDFVTDARSAIVLHCATGRNYSGEAELLRVSAVDFYSGEVLIDTLVSPYGMLLHTDQRNSGISSAMLDNAEKIGYISEDRNAVREALFKFVNPQTTLIVHNGQQLLWLLRWIHLRIIDAYELQKRRFGERAPWDLSQLTSDLLCRRVGQNNRNDNLENVFAIRDCVHWFAVNMPEAHRKEPEELILKYPSRHRTDEERRVFWGRWHHEWRWFARIQWDCLC